MALRRVGAHRPIAKCLLVGMLCAVLTWVPFPVPRAQALSYESPQIFLSPDLGAGDRFGATVAAVGDKILVGAPFANVGADDTGSAYLFDALTGALLQQFRNPARGERDYFGSAVAALGPNVLIGAPDDDANGSNTGAVYLFDSTTGTPIREFRSPNPQPQGRFGHAVAAVGDKVLVGAPFEGGGTVYLFDAVTGQVLQPEHSPRTQDQFGYAIAAVGADFAVGAPSDDGAVADAGAVYFFKGTDGKLLRTLADPNPEPRSAFGASIVTAGNNIVVGSNPDALGPGGSTKVAAHAYLLDPNDLESLRQTFDNPLQSAEDDFGLSLASVSSYVLVGTPGDSTTLFQAGAVYVFDATSGRLVRTLVKYPPDRSDRFGESIAALGDDVLVGAPGVDIGEIANAGAVYLFRTIVVSSPPDGGVTTQGPPPAAITTTVTVTVTPVYALAVPAEAVYALVGLVVFLGGWVVYRNRNKRNSPAATSKH